MLFREQENLAVLMEKYPFYSLQLSYESGYLLQGFVSIAEVDTKGRARRLPIRADIRRALCFPGGSTLMVSHLSNDNSANFSDAMKKPFTLKLHEKSPSLDVQIQGLGDGGGSLDKIKPPTDTSLTFLPDVLIKYGFQKDEGRLNGKYAIICPVFFSYLMICKQFYCIRNYIIRLIKEEWNLTDFILSDFAFC